MCIRDRFIPARRTVQSALTIREADRIVHALTAELGELRNSEREMCIRERGNMAFNRKQKLRDNIAAIRTAFILDRENRTATVSYTHLSIHYYMHMHNTVNVLFDDIPKFL